MVFKYVPNDLDRYDRKPPFHVEVRDSNYVADFHIKLTEMIHLSGSECFVEFYREHFFIFVGEKLEADDKIEGGATVFAFIKTHKSLKNFAD